MTQYKETIDKLQANLSRSNSYPIIFPIELIQQVFLKSILVEKKKKEIKDYYKPELVKLDIDQMQKTVHRGRMGTGLQYFKNRQDPFKHKILLPVNLVI